ncbi:hypothetical protein [Gordonia sp. NPDC003422]
MTDAFGEALADAWRGVRQPAAAADRWPTHRKKARNRRRRRARRAREANQ